MLHACVTRFNATGNLKKNWFLGWTKQGPTKLVNCWGLSTAFPSLVAPEDLLRPWTSVPRSFEHYGAEIRGETNGNVSCMIWVNAGTEPMAEAARNEAEDLRIFPCRRIGEDTSEDAAATRNLRWPWAEEPPMPPRRRLRGRPEVQALTSRCPKRVARVELVMWNYLNGLWSVDCNEGICRDIPPPSRVIFVIVSDRFPGAI